MQEIDLALKECGIGWFHVLLLTSSIIGLIAGILVTNTTPYILPIAECDLNMSLLQKGLLNAMPYIGMTLVSIFVGFLTDTFGRKIFLVSGFCGLFLCTVVGGSSQSYEVLVVAKFFEGVLFAVSFGPNLTMTSEFCYKEIRDRVILFRSSFKAVAQIIVAAMSWGILSHDWNLSLFNGFLDLHIWNIYIYLMSIWSLVSFVLYLFLPESPKFYITQNKFTEAKHVIFKIYTMNTGKPVETFKYFNLWKNKENDIIDQEPKRKVKITLKQQLLAGLHNVKPMFQPPLVSYLVIISGMNFLSLGFYNIIRLWFPQLSTIVEHYSNFNGENNLCDILDTYTHNLDMKVNTTLSEVCVPTRSGDETYINSMILGCVCIIPFALSGILVNKVGKKNLFIAGGFICVGVTLGIRWANSKFSMVALFSVDVAVLQTLTGLFQASTVELFPTRMRTLAIAVIMTLGRIGTLVGNVAFPILLNLGCSVPFYSLTSVMICKQFNLYKPFVRECRWLSGQALDLQSAGVTAMALLLPKS
ncbi:Synaptic vesicle glycoprotein 2A [Papilio xuthus]|uniref:Synaptic vesicle glycoprotein 2A n=1 Tax=Papilio xuthus TaxID=66420 RepID=A0A194QIC4_PAPXU|nr:Synaptic vesicle glycoprotein 2A [Papilio xuthus]